MGVEIRASAVRQSLLENIRRLRYLDIEVQDVLTRAQFSVERYSRFIAEIGLHEDDIGAARLCDGLEVLD